MSGKNSEGIFRSAGVVTLFFLLVAFSPLLYKVLTIPTDPDTVVLSNHEDAQWIQMQRYFDLHASTRNETIYYRKRFKLDNSAADAILTVQALRSVSVMIDGKMLLPPDPNLREWKKTRSVDLRDFNTAGEHEILIKVYNEKGPAILLAYCKALNLFTGEGWEASYDCIRWKAAIPSGTDKAFKLPYEFPTTFSALLFLLPVYVPLFLMVFYLTTARHFRRPQSRWMSEGWRGKTVSLDPSVVRWVLLALWVALAMNNIMKIDVNLGYDALDHYDYISYVRKTWSVPLATQGWEMFQSLFYYMISAVVSSIFSHFYDNATVAFLLRAIPLLCGVLQVELCYRVVKYIFPEKKNYQIIGTIVGGLCPMNLYYSHYVSNEPLAGLLSGAVLVMGVSFLRLKHPPTIGQWHLPWFSTVD